jgi:hypothetical protein
MADVIDLKTRGLVRPVTMAATERRARAARRRIRNAATLLSNRANFCAWLERGCQTNGADTESLLRDLEQLADVAENIVERE